MTLIGANPVTFESHSRSLARGTGPIGIDARRLADDLSQRLQGEVRFDAGSRALYATDASNYRQVPIGVVMPKNVEDIVQTIAVCREYGAPVLARGGGTSLAGQCCNVAVVMDMSRYLDRILEIDPKHQTARVQPGTILDDLRHAAGQHGLTFGPDPATHAWCTLGGMIGNNSCGVHSVRTGKTVDNVEELEILTYDGLRLRVGPTSDEDLERIIAEGGRRGEIYERLKALRDRYGALIRERYPAIPRRVSGYNLDQLLPENGFHVARALVGTECTCVTFLEATVNLVPDPAGRALLVLGYPDVYTAGDHVPEILAYDPVGIEGIDDRLIGYMAKKELHPTDIHLLPEGGGWLLVEFGAETEEAARERVRQVMDDLKQKKSAPSMKLFVDAVEEERIWTIRESGLGATANVPGMDDTWPGWEDAAVHPENLGDYLRDFRQLLNRYGYECSLYGHFGDGCIHVRIDFDLRTSDGIDKYLAFVNDAADLVVEYGGSFSGEHGDGQSRGALLHKMYGEELVEAYREFKAIWDPAGKMNPGKVVDAFEPNINLRLGTDYSPWQPETYFRFPDDHGSFSRATLRCVGVGKCRREKGGTMCPSYMVTREEKHSTRGRAHLLHEMLQGEVVTDGWQDEHVKEALDLCLACKGCKGDCPVDVDVATYKAEFLSHYYEGRLRPRSAYAFGLIFWWARLASRIPTLANFFTQTPGLSRLAKAIAGAAPERQLPAFARQTFKEWFRQRSSWQHAHVSQRKEGQNSVNREQDAVPEPRIMHPEKHITKHGLRIKKGSPVLLWPDTFNNFFHPETAQAAVEVLEAAGYHVVVPEPFLCCGRPLYDQGMLSQAKRQLRQILDTLRSEIAAGIPIIGLEPSCVAVFRDELPNLFPHDEDARRLQRQTFTLAEFLVNHAEDYEPPKLKRKALIHGHCHHKAIMRMHAEEEILEDMDMDHEILESGCCGMAGSFGFEAGDRYEVSVKVGEHVLLPRVREAKADTLIVTDGFSCREQIRQLTDRRAFHLAEVLQMGLRQAEGDFPDLAQRYWQTSSTTVRSRGAFGWSRPLAALTIVIGALGLVWRLLRGRKDV